MGFDPNKLAAAKKATFDPSKLAAAKTPGMGQQLMQGAGQAVGTALDVVGAPDQLAGESVRVAREGLPFRLPTIAQKLPLVRDINNQYVTAQGQPGSFVGEVASGVQGLTAGAVAPLTGQDPLQAAAAEIQRPKTRGADVALQAGLALAGGQVANAPFNAAAKVVQGLAKPAGKLAALGSSIGTAVPPRDYGVVFDNPSAIMPGRLKKAGEAFEAEASKLGAGIKGAPSPEKIESLKNPKKYAFDLYEQLTGKAPEPSALDAARTKLGLPSTGQTAAKTIGPQQALLGRQAIDSIYPTPNKKNGTYRALLDRIKDSFQAVIAQSPEMQAVSKEYSIAKSGSKFLSPVPLTESGKPGFVRGAAMIEMLRRGEPGMAALGVPALAGGATAAAGLTAKGLAALVKNDPLKAALLAAYLNKEKRK